MSKKVKKKVPVLRFPEFAGDFDWKQNKLKHITKKIGSGATPTGGDSNYKEYGISLFRSLNVYDSFFKNKNLAFIDEDQAKKLDNVKDMYNGNFIDIDSLSRLELDDQEFKKNKAEYGDVFFTRSSLVKEGIAHSNILLNRDQDITYDGHLIRFRFNHKSYLPEFIALALKASTTRKQLVSRGKTGTMTTIGQDDIATVKLSIPSKQEQEKIADFLTSIDQKIDAISKQIELTEQFKKGLLQKMFV